MAVIVGSNGIYPPVVSPFAPNFIIDGVQGCRIYFSISAYNSISEYTDVHITVTKQSDNLSALNKNTYPSQIKIISAELNTGSTVSYTKINIDQDRQSDDKYFIALSNDDIQDGFETGIVYKVQMRFSESAWPRQEIQRLDDYLTSHRQDFSEWSQVCLVQGIHQPIIEIKNSQGGILTSSSTNFWNVDTFELVGNVDTDASDPLRQYTLSLYDNNNILIETSDVLFPAYQSYNNQINYVFKHALEDGEYYTLKVEYMTYGLYTEVIEYSILALLNLIEKLDVNISGIEDTENGRIGIEITSASTAPFAGRITIRRTSSKSNFQLWEDVHTTELRAEKLEYLWYDYTIESGVWYKYCVQKRDAADNRGIITQLDNPVMIIFDSLFLNADDTQIKIKFNPQVSSFQTVVSDTKIDTLGGKYPYIKRNGATQYRQFPISGLISFLMDEDKIFAGREDFYSDEVIDLYDEYNQKFKNRIGLFDDITYERDYRQKVMDFLYKHNVKLFRSATEGNILVKLTDINFTPNQTLGRRIYSFQCTAYEIDDFTIANCDKYNIQNIIKMNNTTDLLVVKSEYEGQWEDIIPAATEFVHSDPAHGEYSILETYYQKFQKEKYILSVEKLDYLRLEIYDEPYLIYDNGQGPQPLSNFSNPAAEVANAAYLGYIAYINGKTIVLPADGIYELRGDNVQITSLQFEKNTDLEIRYHVVLSQIENIGKVLALTTFTEKIGQEWGGFLPGDSLYNKLVTKYFMEHPGDYYQNLVSINSVKIEANPGTVVYVREEGETNAQRHVLGENAVMEFNSMDYIIGDVFFTGIHFEPATEQEALRDMLPEGKYYNTNIVVNNLDEITDPREQYVYYLEAEPINNNFNFTNEESAGAPELATLVTAKGLPMLFIKKDDIEGYNNIAIVDQADIEELETYLTDQNYDIYITDSIVFTNDEQLKIATLLNDESETIEFVLDTTDNKNKLAAYKVILDQYGAQQITAALKRSIWKNIIYNVSNYYIYYRNHWYVFDETQKDAVCPVPALVDYWCELIKGYYRTN